MARVLRGVRQALAPAGEDATDGGPSRGEGPTPSDGDPGGAAYAFLAPPAAAGELGRLGPYRVLAELGRGGMGIVFRAEDPQLGRPVALKVMLPGRGLPADRQRFLREARAAAAVRCDHVVTIHHVGEERGAPFLVMELLAGEPLDRRLRRAGPLPVPEALRIGAEVAAGLAAAHARGLVHRDVKPANVWVEAGTGRAKLLDFGLARAAEPAGEVSAPGLVLGTPAYMAPEQARGEDVDGRADVFGLGCVLYALLAGSSPFARETTLATLRAVEAFEPPPPHAARPGVPAAVSALVSRLLAKDRADRPSAAEAAAALNALLAAGPPGAARDTPPAGEAEPTRRRLRVGGRLALCATVPLLLLLAWWVWNGFVGTPVVVPVVPPSLARKQYRFDVVVYSGDLPKAANIQTWHWLRAAPAGAEQPVSVFDPSQLPGRSKLSGLNGETVDPEEWARVPARSEITCEPVDNHEEFKKNCSCVSPKCVGKGRVSLIVRANDPKLDNHYRLRFTVDALTDTPKRP